MIPWKKPLENKKLVIMVILLGDLVWYLEIIGVPTTKNHQTFKKESGGTMNFTHHGPWDSTFDIFHDIFHGDSTYPLVNIQKAMENGHRNSGFSH